MCGVCVCVEVVVRYRDKIKKLESEIHEILKAEEEEKQVCVCGHTVIRCGLGVAQEMTDFLVYSASHIRNGSEKSLQHDRTPGGDFQSACQDMDPEDCWDQETCR